MSRAKYNRTQSENRAIADRISELRMQGLPKDRATAAAFRMFKEGELTIKIDNIRAQPGKTAQEVAIEKAVMIAAERIRRQAEQDKKRIERAELMARRARLEAKKTGEAETVQEQQERLRTEPLGRLLDSTRRRQI
jgi:hypothetical protein